MEWPKGRLRSRVRTIAYSGWAGKHFLGGCALQSPVASPRLGYGVAPPPRAAQGPLRDWTLARCGLVIPWRPDRSRRVSSGSRTRAKFRLDHRAVRRKNSVPTLNLPANHVSLLCVRRASAVLWRTARHQRGDRRRDSWPRCVRHAPWRLSLSRSAGLRPGALADMTGTLPGRRPALRRGSWSQLTSAA